MSVGKVGGRDFMKIEINSRERIEKFANEPFPAHTALISITDSDKDFPVLKNKPEYLLQLKFDDVTNEDIEYHLGRKPTEAETLMIAEKIHMFNDEQAAEVAAFIKPILRSAGLLICQCEYGQSRSAGIAAAVRQFLYNDGIEIFADERYYPNKLVYRKVFAALEG